MGEESVEACIEELNREVSEAEEKEMAQLPEETRALRVMRDLLICLNEGWDLLEKRIALLEISDDKKAQSTLRALLNLRRLDLEKMRLSMENLNNIRDMEGEIIDRVGKVVEANEVMFQIEIFLYDMKSLEERIEKLREPQRSFLLKKLQHLKIKSRSLIEDAIRKIEVIFSLSA